MKRYLAIDSGGTKVLAVLYDEDFRPLRVCRTGSMRANTTSAALVQKNLDALVDGLGIAGTTIDQVFGLYDVKVVQKQLEERGVTIASAVGCGELEAGLSAAELFGDALVAISGTGTTLAARYQGRNYFVGGYGAAVSDEGSGYWMARHAFGAAIKDAEGRGPKTMLTDLLIQNLGGNGDLRSAIFSIYWRTDSSPVACVASCAPLVSVAAEAGDEIAQNILKKTGAVLAQQIGALVRTHGLPQDLPITISGSVWRSHPLMLQEFCRVLREEGLTKDVLVPPFEPIVGIVIEHYRRLHGSFDEEASRQFRQLYKDFTFSITT